MAKRRSRLLEHLSEYDAVPVRRSPRLSSRYSRGDTTGSVPFPLSTLSYSATSRQTLSGFKEYDAPSTSILNESGQSVPAAFDQDFQDGGSDMPEHLYGLDGSGEEDAVQPGFGMKEDEPRRFHVSRKERIFTPPHLSYCFREDGAGIIDHGILLLYKLGSLFYLFAAGIFCLDVMVLHRLYAVFHAMAGGLDTRPTKSWQRFYVLPLVMGALVVFLLGGGLIPPPTSTPLSVGNGTEINITEVRVQVIKAVTPLVIEELRNTLQQRIELQVEKRLQGLNVSLELYKSAVNASMEQQVYQLEQHILKLSEGQLTEALIMELIRSQMEYISAGQVQETDFKLQEAKAEITAQLQQYKEKLRQLENRDEANSQKFAKVLQLSGLQSDLGDRVDALEVQLQDVASDVSTLAKATNKHEQQLGTVQQDDAKLHRSFNDFAQRVQDRVSALEETSKDAVAPAEVVRVFNEELQKAVTGRDGPLKSWLSQHVDDLKHLSQKVKELEEADPAGTGFRRKDVEQLIDAALHRYSADKIAKFDFALENSGGSVVVSKCSATYGPTQGTVSILGIPLGRVNSSPRLLIQPQVYPGDCWAFEGSKGHALIKLQGRVVITGVSLEHIPRELTPNGSRVSAPKEFQVRGKTSPDEEPGTLLGTFSYTLEGMPIQQFNTVVKESQAYEYVYFDFLSNHAEASSWMAILRSQTPVLIVERVTKFITERQADNCRLTAVKAVFHCDE